MQIRKHKTSYLLVKTILDCFFFVLTCIEGQRHVVRLALKVSRPYLFLYEYHDVQFLNIFLSETKKSVNWFLFLHPFNTTDLFAKIAGVKRTTSKNRMPLLSLFKVSWSKTNFDWSGATAKWLLLTLFYQQQFLSASYMYQFFYLRYESRSTYETAMSQAQEEDQEDQEEDQWKNNIQI